MTGAFAVSASPLRWGWGLATALGLAGAAAAGPAADRSSRATGPDPANDAVLAELGYQEAHPDLQHRQLGIGYYRRGQPARALAQFRRAGYHGDKPSQSLAARMYWQGEGAPRDRVLGYLWMDLAAERGYPDLVAVREAYWAAMTEDERRRALRQGPALYAVYGDAAAKPRYARRLARLRNQTTGSHLGTDVGVRSTRVKNGPYMLESGSADFHARTYPEPQHYWEQQDRAWRQRSGGEVTVGTLEAMDADARPTLPSEREGPAPPQSPEPRPR